MARGQPPAIILGNRLLSIIQRATEKTVHKRAEQIEANLNELYRKFWSILGSKIIDSPGAPDLDAWTPDWDPLTEAYLAKKKKRGKNFFLFSGRLKSWLASGRGGRDPKTAFGKPIIKVIQAGKSGGEPAVVVTNSKGREQGRSLVSGKVLSLKKIAELAPRGIQIDLYPRVRETIADGIEAGDYIGYTSRAGDHAAFALDNFRGRKDRNILGPYMLWYLNTEARRALTGVGK